MNVNKVMKKNILLSLILLSFSLFITGCAPRGESKSLDQVLALAKVRYEKTKQVGAPEKIQPVLTDLVSSLNKMETGSAEQISKSAEHISELMEHASFTNRAAFAEIATQYRLAGEQADTISSATLKLLAARTYSLLASELETARFRL